MLKIIVEKNSIFILFEILIHIKSSDNIIDYNFGTKLNFHCQIEYNNKTMKG